MVLHLHRASQPALSAELASPTYKTLAGGPESRRESRVIFSYIRYVIFSVRHNSIFILATFIVACNSAEKKQERSEAYIDTTSVVSQPSFTNIEAGKIDSAHMPTNINYKGKFFEAWKWNDRNGENILVTSLIEPASDAEPNESGEVLVSAELYAVHYLKNNKGHKSLWKITDQVKDCGFDLTVAFIKGSITVTDLDKDDTAETWIQYKTTCRSDVSPAYMKLIMHEGVKKYSLRGNMWIRTSEQDNFTVTEQTGNLEKLPKKKDEFEQLTQSFGRYENEKDFLGAPPVFLDYARKQWMKFVIESFE